MSGSDKDYELIKSEINKLKSALDDSDGNKCDENSLKWSDIASKPGRKAMIIGIVLSILNQCCGCFAMLQYTANIFEEAGSSMSANDSTICVGVIQLIGSYVATNLVDRAGRKVKHFSLSLNKNFVMFYFLSIFRYYSLSQLLE